MLDWKLKEEKKVKAILLCDLNINTLSKTFLNWDIDKKINFLNLSLTKFKILIDREFKNNIQEIKGIFVAPEYYFAKSNTVGDVRQYSYEERKDIEKEIAKLSAAYAYKDILIIPGTISWKKNTPPPENNNNQNFNNFSCSTLLTKQPISKNDYILDKRARGIYKNLEKKYEEHSKKTCEWGSLLGNEIITNSQSAQNFGSFDKDVPLNNPLSKKAQLKKTNLVELSISKNTANFYLAGERVHKYHKSSDFQEVLNPNNNVYIPGIEHPLLEIGGIIFGIEICLDHACEVLKKNIANNIGAIMNPIYSSIQDKGGVDIHLILSAAVQNKYSQAHKNGYLIHSSSNFWSRTYKKGNNELDITKLNSPPLTAVKLEI